MPPAADVVVVIREDGTWIRSTAFEGVPVVTPCRIEIEAGNSLSGKAAAKAVDSELRAVFQASAAGVVTTDVTCEWDQPDITRELLVLILETNLGAPAWLNKWESDIESVLPVMAFGQAAQKLLPDSLRALNVCFWTKSITEAVPAVLSRSGLSLPDHRVFISYRRIETQGLADQLFDELTHQGFDVFLDRFTIEPGVNFQRRLDQELADKAMVLLLESAQAHTSKWTDHEIQFAKRHQLGMLALQLPDRAKPLPGIDVDDRMVLADPDFEAVPEEGKAWAMLTEAKLGEVVARVKTAHDRAVFRRRHYLRSSVSAALKKGGLTPGPVDSDGLIRLQAPAKKYAVWVTTRPPELGDFHLPSTRLLSGETGVVVGPLAALEPGRKASLEWLRGRCQFGCLDPDDMPDGVARMKAGTL